MSVEKIGSKYRAKVYFMGQNLHIGMFSTQKLAEQAVREAQREFLHGKDRDLIEKGEGSSLWARIKRRLRTLTHH